MIEIFSIKSESSVKVESNRLDSSLMAPPVSKSVDQISQFLHRKNHLSHPKENEFAKYEVHLINNNKGFDNNKRKPKKLKTKIIRFSSSTDLRDLKRAVNRGIDFMKQGEAVDFEMKIIDYASIKEVAAKLRMRTVFDKIISNQNIPGKRVIVKAPFLHQQSIFMRLKIK